MTLALLAAQDDRLAGRVSVVAGVAPFTDLGDLIRIATTGRYSEHGALHEFRAGPFLGLCVGRSVCAGIAPGPDREALVELLARVPSDDPDPLACLGGHVAGELGDEAQAALALLTNRDPERFDELYAALSAPMRSGIERLSPVRAADRLRVPVELLSDPADKYFPLSHARALARGAPGVRVTLTRSLAHADLSLAGLRDLAGVAAAASRAIALARAGS
jgi:hypothetical protein